ARHRRQHALSQKEAIRALSAVRALCTASSCRRHGWGHAGHRPPSPAASRKFNNSKRLRQYVGRRHGRCTGDARSQEKLMFKTLRIKLLLGIAPLLTIMVALGLWAVVMFTRLGGRIDVILRENYRSVL